MRDHEGSSLPAVGTPDWTLSPITTHQREQHEVSIAFSTQFAAALTVGTSRDDGPPMNQDEATGGRPARWRCIVDLKLRPRREMAAELWLPAHDYLLSALLAYPDDMCPAVQLRLLAVPSAGHPELHVTCRLGVTADTAAQAELALRDLVTLFVHASGRLHIAYEFSASDPRADRPGPGDDAGVWDMVEVAAPVEVLPESMTAGLTLPLPLGIPGGGLTDLCAALVAQAASGSPCAWLATLEPFAAGNLQYLLERETVAAADELQTLQHLAGIGRGGVALLERAHRLQKGAALTAAHAMQARAPLGRVQAFLCCRDRIVPDWLVAAARVALQRAISGDDGAMPLTVLRPVRPRERAAVFHALRARRCVAWEAANGTARAPMDADARLRLLVTARSALTLFRLPLPTETGLPGLPAERRDAERWLRRQGPSRDDGIGLGTNVAGPASQPVYLSRDDRRRHMYVVGQTGVGKSHLLEQLAVQDIERGESVIVLDPHGDLIDHLLARIPPGRKDDVILLDPAAADLPVGFNLLDCADTDQRYRVVEEFIGTLQKLYDPHNQGVVGPRFKHAVRNAMLTVMDGPGGSLVEVVRVLTDDRYVRERLPHVQDPMVRRYWSDQVAKTTDFHRSEVLDYVVSKFSAFVSHPLMRNIVGQRHSAFQMRQVMDEGKILLVSLAQGRLGMEISHLLAAVLIPEVLLAAFSRTAVPEEARRDCFLYVDEFQHYASPTFVELLTGARKYRLNLTVANQHVGQLDAETRAAVFGNVGAVVAFRVGLQDAPVLAAALQPDGFAGQDYLALPNYRAYARVPLDGRPSPCFSFAPSHFPGPYDLAWAASVRRAALRRWGRPRSQVERELVERASL